jgi:hypothetical protein
MEMQSLQGAAASTRPALGHKQSVVSVWYRAAKLVAERLFAAMHSLFRMNFGHRIGKPHEDPS